MARRRAEFQRISWLRARNAGPGGEVVRGPGDDCAVLRPRKGEDWVWTTDSLVEGTHFRPGWLSAEELGRKVVEISLSDLAAMGARPVAILASAELPAAYPERDFRRLCTGIEAAALEADARLAGGNLARSPSHVSLTTTAIGAVPRGKAILRSGARPGDAIWTTGAPGSAALGLGALERWGRQRAPRGYRPYVTRFTRPRARVAEARWLGRRSLTALIDTSDGLLADLGHILEESDLGAAVALAGPTDTFRALAARLDRDPIELLLAGGEEYELIACAEAGALDRSARAFERRFGIPLTQIGRITGGRGLRVEVDGRSVDPTARGYDHFSSDGDPS